MSTEQRDPLVDFLNGKLYTAAEVAAAGGVKANSLVNLLSKSNLELCSQAKGRGKARDFCLIDAYALALMDRLTRTLKDYDLAAENCNELLYGECRIALDEGRLPWRTDGELKEGLCGDIYKAHPVFFERDLDRPHYFVGTAENLVVSQDLHTIAQGAETGIYVFNLTLIFTTVDLTLARLRNFDLARIGQVKAERAAAQAFADGLRPDPPSAGKANDER